MKTKIIHITQSYGGVEVYLRSIIKNINKNEFSLIVLGPSNSNFELFCSENNVLFSKINLTRGFNPFKDIISLVQMIIIIFKLNPDLIHVHSSKAGLIGRIAAYICRTKSIFTPHGISYLSFSGIKRSLFITIEYIASKFSYKILTCSNSEMIRYQFEMGIKKPNISTLSNAIEIDEALNIINNKISFTKSSETIKIGSIARLTFQKNPLLFVEIANKILSEYPTLNIEFSILGTGLTDHLKNDVERQIKLYKIQDKFTLLGWGDRKKSEDYLKSLDIFILPSIFEGLPLSLLEAMSYGVICITSKSDGCNDVIQNGYNGYSCITVDEYFSTFQMLIDNVSLQQKIRENAYNYIYDKHNIDKFIHQLEIYYKNTCE